MRTIHSPEPPAYGPRRAEHNRDRRIIVAWDCYAQYRRELEAGASPDDAEEAALARLRAEHLAEEAEARDLIALARQTVRAAA